LDLLSFGSLALAPTPLAGSENEKGQAWSLAFLLFKHERNKTRSP
jgi:hypothetical protein